MRKVIHITNNGIHLCDDGTMWKREMVTVDQYGNRSSGWLQLDNVPQPAKFPPAPFEAPKIRKC